MSADELPSRRAEPRFLTELALVVSEVSGKIVDQFGKAHDVSQRGFRAETSAKLKVGDEFGFQLRAEVDAAPIRGRARAMWVEPNPWGGVNVGAKITRISWADSRRLRKGTLAEGFDFAAIAKLAWKAAYWIVIVAGLDNIIFHQPQLRKLIGELQPVLIALFFLGLGLLLLLRRD